MATPMGGNNPAGTGPTRKTRTQADKETVKKGGESLANESPEQDDDDEHGDEDDEEMCSSKKCLQPTGK